MGSLTKNSESSPESSLRRSGQVKSDPKRAESPVALIELECDRSLGLPIRIEYDTFFSLSEIQKSDSDATDFWWDSFKGMSDISNKDESLECCEKYIDSMYYRVCGSEPPSSELASSIQENEDWINQKFEEMLCTQSVNLISSDQTFTDQCKTNTVEPSSEKTVEPICNVAVEMSCNIADEVHSITVEPCSSIAVEQPKFGIQEQPESSFRWEPSSSITEELSSGITQELNSSITEEPSSGITEELSSGITQELNSGIREEPIAGITEELSSGITQELSSGITEEPICGITQEQSSSITEKPICSITEELSSGIPEEPSMNSAREPSPDVMMALISDFSHGKSFEDIMPRQSASSVLKIPVTIQGLTLMAVLDTAAVVTILSDKVYQALEPQPPYWKAVRLQTASKVKMHGHIVGPVSLSLGSAVFPGMVVVAPIQDDMLLGLDFLLKYGIDIKLAPLQLTVRVANGDVSVPLQIFGSDGDAKRIAKVSVDQIDMTMTYDCSKVWAKPQFNLGTNSAVLKTVPGVCCSSSSQEMSRPHFGDYPGGSRRQLSESSHDIVKTTKYLIVAGNCVHTGFTVPPTTLKSRTNVRLKGVSPLVLLGMMLDIASLVIDTEVVLTDVWVDRLSIFHPDHLGTRAEYMLRHAVSLDYKMSPCLKANLLQEIGTQHYLYICCMAPNESSSHGCWQVVYGHGTQVAVCLYSHRETGEFRMDPLKMIKKSMVELSVQGRTRPFFVQ